MEDAFVSNAPNIDAIDEENDGKIIIDDFWQP